MQQDVNRCFIAMIDLNRTGPIPLMIGTLIEPLVIYRVSMSIRTELYKYKYTIGSLLIYFMTTEGFYSYSSALFPPRPIPSYLGPYVPWKGRGRG